MKQLFLIFAFLIGYSLTASAEKIKLVPRPVTVHEWIL